MFRVRFSILFSVIVIAITGVSFSQTELNARKFAEFRKMSQAGVKQKMESFLAELAKDRPAQGYIIIYGSPKTIAARRKQITDSISFLTLDPTRITYVEGSYEKTVRTVMWIVPAGATPPKP